MENKLNEQDKNFDNLASSMVSLGLADAIKPIIAGFVKDAKNFIGKDEKRIILQYVENEGKGEVLAVVIHTKEITQEMDWSENGIVKDKNGKDMVFVIEDYANQFIAGKFDFKV